MLWYGGDYNPEQWPREVWAEDVRLMRTAGVTVATVGVFSWAKLEPRDGVFEFEWLDDVIDGLHAAGIRVDLATATASPPPWLTTAYPEVLATTAEGHRWSQGSRAHHNPSSRRFREHADRLVTRLAERYARHPALVSWHVGNEFGNEVPRDFGEESAVAFRDWLRARYGSLDRLNEAWGTSFWSQQYASFDEVQPPRTTPTFPNPSQALDYERFGSEALLAAYRAEVAILRAVDPAIPITTNFMGPFKPADYWAWAEEVDFVTDDCYPDPHDLEGHVYGALRRDLMRSLAGPKPWLVMEQSTSAVNWRRVNAAKRPGQLRAQSLQAIARGADGVMFFQWRQAVRGAEKFHSAMLPYTGTDTRIWREVVALGAELGRMAEIAGAAVEPARVAIVFDWESWWAIEQGAMPAEIDYLSTVTNWYASLYDLGVLVDFVRRGDPDLGRYDLVVCASSAVCSEAVLEGLDAYVRGGGRLLVTYLTATLDPEARLMPGGPLGRLQETLGVRVEEFVPRPPSADRSSLGASAEIVFGAGPEAHHPIGTWAEVVHTVGAQTVAAYGPGDLGGLPAVTRHARADGEAWYLSADLERSGRAQLLRLVLASAGVPIVPPPAGVEIVRRGDLTFAINHHPTRAAVVGLEGVDIATGEAIDGAELAPFDVRIVRGAALSTRARREGALRS